MSTLIFMAFFIKPFLPLRNEDLNERLIDVQLILFKRWHNCIAHFHTFQLFSNWIRFYS